ncbi:hypothetical protein EI94DRAFT_1812659 [Lactarius quietus]|nr:hypothetical protein EI94DRAFT_1812659 [Lactarius quietus]
MTMVNYGVEDIIDVYLLPVDILAALGDLDEDKAGRLQAYCQDKFLGPLELLETRRQPRDDSSVVEIPPPPQPLKQRCTGKHKLQVAKHQLNNEEE